MKWYDVTVTFGPETVHTRASDEESAKLQAAKMIGCAGFEKLSTYQVKQASQGDGSTI